MKSIQEVDEMMEAPEEEVNGQISTSTKQQVKEVEEEEEKGEGLAEKEEVVVADDDDDDDDDTNNDGSPPPSEKREIEKEVRVSKLQQEEEKDISDNNNGGGVLLPEDVLNLPQKKDDEHIMEPEPSLSLSQLQQQQQSEEYDSFPTTQIVTPRSSKDNDEQQQHKDGGGGDDDDGGCIYSKSSGFNKFHGESLGLSSSSPPKKPSSWKKFERESLGKSIRGNIDIDFTVQEIENLSSSPTSRRKGKIMSRSISTRFTKVAKAIHLLKDRKKKRVDETHKHYLTAHCIRDGIKYVLTTKSTNTNTDTINTINSILGSNTGRNTTKSTKDNNNKIAEDSFHQVERFTLPMTIAASSSATQQQQLESQSERHQPTIPEDTTPTTTSQRPPNVTSAYFSTSFGSSLTSNASSSSTKNNTIAKGHFEFKEYAPLVFLKLRQHWGVTQEDYMSSLVSEDLYLDFQSNSKSGQFFFFSDDKFFLIKTLTSQEVRWFSDALQTYYEHFMDYPDSLLVKFMGLYRIKMPFTTTSRRLRKIHFVVMRSTFDTVLPMHKKFDLKGSRVGREASESDKKKLSPVLKDNDLEKSGIKLNLKHEKSKFLKQLEIDCKLLSNLNMMDYSLLIGIFDKSRIDPIHGIDDTTIREILRQDNCLHYIDRLDEYGVIYFVGIIDFLQHYNTRKRMETFSKTIVNDSTEISSVPPTWYSRRLVNFITKFVV